jgi:hypothetical protein
VPLQQYSSLASQYDWMLAAYGHWKPEGRGAN